MKIKLIKTRKLAWKIIYNAISNNKRLSDITKETMAKSSLNDRDKRFIIDLVQGAIRMKGRLSWELKKIYKNNWEELDLKVKIVLWLGAYQMKYMDKIPDYAIVSTSVSLTKEIYFKTSGIVNALLRKYSLICNGDKGISIKDKDWADFVSHPRWLVEKWSKTYSNGDLESLCNWNNKKPVIWFRLNLMQMSVSERDIYLNENDFEFENWKYDDIFFKVNHTSRLLNSQIFKEGKISIQNPAAGLVVRLLNPKKRECIVDTCAALGGKTSFMSQLMKNTGKIFAYDSDINRLNTFVKGISKLKVDNVDAVVADMTRYKLQRSTKIIADVPCTGTGVMSKRADLRWRRTLDNLHELVNIQKAILNNSSDALMKNGVLVYSTCSIEYEENWGVINQFLNIKSNWVVDSADKYIPKEYVDSKGALNIFPPKHNIDGGFAVRLIRRK